MVASPEPIDAPGSSGSRTTAVFVKRPIAGAVKTRLVPPLDADQARTLALAMLDDAVRIHSVSSGGHSVRSGGGGLELAVAPVGSSHWFEVRYPGVTVREQRGEDLGERLANWFADRMAQAPDEARSFVVFGADCPRLTPALIAGAHERIEAGADVVFAPDGGGGYALVGLARPAPELFTEIEMSTADNLAQTLDLAEKHGLSIELLPAQLDVDTEPDLLRLARELNTLVQVRGSAEGLADFPMATHKVLLELLEGCPTGV